MSHQHLREGYKCLEDTNSEMVFLINFWKPGLSNGEEFNFQKEGPLVNIVDSSHCHLQPDDLKCCRPVECVYTLLHRELPNEKSGLYQCVIV
jgi:hypothetical protein